MSEDYGELVTRLRGIYVVPVDDGAGLLRGEATFTRRFDVPPIQLEAAGALVSLQARADQLAADCARFCGYNERLIKATGAETVADALRRIAGAQQECERLMLARAHVDQQASDLSNALRTISAQRDGLLAEAAERDRRISSLEQECHGLRVVIADADATLVKRSVALEQERDQAQAALRMVEMRLLELHAGLANRFPVKGSDLVDHLQETLSQVLAALGATPTADVKGKP